MKKILYFFRVESNLFYKNIGVAESKEEALRWIEKNPARELPNCGIEEIDVYRELIGERLPGFGEIVEVEVEFVVRSRYKL